MRALKFIYLLIGVGLLAAVLIETDIAQVAGLVLQVGWGMVIVLLLYFLAFAIDTFTWQLTLPSADLGRKWLYRLFQVRLAGEAFNNTTPAGGMGGEPVKAYLLKKYYAIGYREGTASLVLAKTVNMISLVVFLAVGFALMLRVPTISGAYKGIAGAGLAALAAGIILFFLIQRLKISSLAGSWIAGLSFGGTVRRVLHNIEDLDTRLVAFYAQYRRRFAWAVTLAWVNWLLGALEIYVTMIFLGHPISITDAWIIEAVAQLVRAGTFFIPASIGAQEGAFLLIGAAITGSPVLGIAVAVVRRFREILWIAVGFAVLLVLRPLEKAPETPNAS